MKIEFFASCEALGECKFWYFKGTTFYSSTTSINYI